VLAANPRLELMRFPTATPDLNPQEHVWKAARQEISHNHDERHLQPLAESFRQYLADHTFTSSLLHRYGFDAVCPMFM
jgi:transposase